MQSIFILWRPESYKSVTDNRRFPRKSPKHPPEHPAKLRLRGHNERAVRGLSGVEGHAPHGEARSGRHVRGLRRARLEPVPLATFERGGTHLSRWQFALAPTWTGRQPVAWGRPSFSVVCQLSRGPAKRSDRPNAAAIRTRGTSNGTPCHSQTIARSLKSNPLQPPQNTRQPHPSHPIPAEPRATLMSGKETFALKRLSATRSAGTNHVL